MRLMENVSCKHLFCIVFCVAAWRVLCWDCTKRALACSSFLMSFYMQWSKSVYPVAITCLETNRDDVCSETHLFICRFYYYIASFFLFCWSYWEFFLNFSMWLALTLFRDTKENLCAELISLTLHLIELLFLHNMVTLQWINTNRASLSYDNGILLVLGDYTGNAIQRNVPDDFVIFSYG